MKEYFSELCQRIKSFGFRVFVTTRRQSYYGFYSDGTHIAYFQYTPHVAITLSTHNKVGHGYAVYNGENREFGMDDISRELLLDGFVTYPNWVKPYDQTRVVKYKGLDEFLANYWDKDNLEEV